MCIQSARRADQSLTSIPRNRRRHATKTLLGTAGEVMVIELEIVDNVYQNEQMSEPTRMKVSHTTTQHNNG